MRYFHRTSLRPEEVLAEADRHFGGSLEETTRSERSREYAGTIGKVRVGVRAEGGHYVNISAETDQVGESELDKLAKRFLALVHKRVEPGHRVRGAY